MEAQSQTAEVVTPTPPQTETIRKPIRRPRGQGHNYRRTWALVTPAMHAEITELMAISNLPRTEVIRRALGRGILELRESFKAAFPASA